MILDVIAFLEGRTNKIERDLEQRMQEASERHQFEEAARTRNRLMAVRHLSERQAVSVGHRHLRRDRARRRGRRRQRAAARGARRPHRGAPVALPRERRGGGRGRAARALPARLLRRAGRHPAADLRAHRGRRRRPDRGLPVPAPRGRASRCAWPSAATSAASSPWRCATRSSACAMTCCARSARSTRRIEGLEELRESLNLEALPIRIECFDISNLQDTNAVASMVVFEDGAAKRSDYRRFGIRHGRRPGRLPLARRGRHAPLRAPPARRRGRLRPQLRDAPEPARDRRRQGSARRGARRDAQLRPAARGGRLAGQARGGGLPARALANP